jgi:hypothetical protein
MLFHCAAEVDTLSKGMKEVKAAEIQVVTEDFLEKAKDPLAIAELIKTSNIASWGGDVSTEFLSIILIETCVISVLSLYVLIAPVVIRLLISCLVSC